MSKSKGNVVDPLVLIDEYGADALRLTMGDEGRARKRRAHGPRRRRRLS